MSQRGPFVIRPEDVVPYSPANHTGTRNYRLVGPGVNGAKGMEIVLGDIERSEGADAHAHPDMEQAAYILEGEALSEIDGVEYHVRPGDLCFFPANVFHSIKVLTERLKVLVVYSPPYGESPEKVTKSTDSP
jgi:quercetin dioxygenase-like cupin family protein